MNYLLTTLCLEFPRREGFAGAGAGGFETSFVLNHPIESPYKENMSFRFKFNIIVDPCQTRAERELLEQLLGLNQTSLNRTNE